MIPLTKKQAQLVIWNTMDAFARWEPEASELQMLIRIHKTYEKETGLRLIDAFRDEYEYQEWFDKL